MGGGTGGTYLQDGEGVREVIRGPAATGVVAGRPTGLKLDQAVLHLNRAPGLMRTRVPVVVCVPC